MVKRIADNQNPGSLATRLRRKCLALFHSLLSCLDGPLHILDVGGTERFWQLAGIPIEKTARITLMNLEKPETSMAGITGISGDAREIRFPNKHFDVVFSNSVIEHVGGFADQQRMANEVRRVGMRYFIQTPNRNFPIEPHFVFPFYQFLPEAVQIWLAQNFDLGWMKRTPDRTKARELVASIRLLDRAKFMELFPDGVLYQERILGLTKSLIAYGGWSMAQNCRDF